MDRSYYFNSIHVCSNNYIWSKLRQDCIHKSQKSVVLENTSREANKHRKHKQSNGHSSGELFKGCKMKRLRELLATEIKNRNTSTPHSLAISKHDGVAAKLHFSPLNSAKIQQPCAAIKSSCTCYF